jgi:ferric-dicitrate binding protein FerR (iron transport regulator)
MGQEGKNYTWNLIAKKLMGEATPQELHELESLLRNNPELHYPMQTISDLWKSSVDADKEEAEIAFSRHLDRLKELKVDYKAENPCLSEETDQDSEASYPWPKKRSGTGKRVFIIAALFCGLLGLTVWLFNRTNHAESMPIAHLPVATGNEIFTANGSRTHLTLPDGTLVWLNAGSRLTYGKNYNTGDREINLTGEAFFDVVRNVQKPFVIHTARIDITVLGTSFNVKSYPTDKTTEATLVHGSIEVSIKDRPTEKIILKPNEKLVVANDDSTLHRSVAARHTPGDTDESLVAIRKPTYEQTTGAIIETAWIDNKLTFREEAFGDLAAQMERWYGVTIRFGDPALEQLHFTGSFKEETIEQALEALKLTAAFSYTTEGNQVTINKQ